MMRRAVCVQQLLTGHRRIISGKATADACTKRQTYRHHDDGWLKQFQQ